MLPLLLATRNAHKTREFAALLGPGFAVADLTARNDLPEVEETGRTFEQNAVIKAISASAALPGVVVADDSGLEVDSLGGAPGVYSARYAGEKASDEANLRKLLAELRGKADRRAQFRCVLALAEGGEVIATFDGRLPGFISTEAAGTSGFGYDPVFVPEGYQQTLAELGARVKNVISHRARAVAALRDYLLGNKKGGENRRP